MIRRSWNRLAPRRAAGRLAGGSMLGASVLLAAACSIKHETSPSRFYMLSAVSAEGSSAPSAADGGGRPSPTSGSRIWLAVGPVTLPAYLDRPQIVTRSGDNEVELAEFDRWAEPLHEGLTAVLAENLGRLVPTERVELYPSGPATEMDLRVEVEVIRFDGALGGDVVLDARWRILRQDRAALETVPVIAERSRTVQRAPGADYAALVGALSQAVEALSRRLADEVRRAAR